jgi:hypothetical protein
MNGIQIEIFDKNVQGAGSGVVVVLVQMYDKISSGSTDRWKK